MLMVGLTGGIGSGKSTVARRLAERGAQIVDADRVAREIVEPGEPALDEIRERFGDAVIADDGRLDRPALAEIVFGDDEARRDLEAITHPQIGERIAERVASFQREAEERGTTPIVVVDHPLLVESGQSDRFPVVIVVTAPEETRIRRLVEQRGMDEEDARARIASQASDVERTGAATHVIDNSGSLDELEPQIDELWEDLRRRARETAA